MIAQLLPLFIIVPFVALIACLSFPKKWERAIATVATTALSINFLLFLVLCIFWARNGFETLFFKALTIYTSPIYTFSVDFFFDKISAVFFGITCITSVLIFMFSKYYMHRDQGFKRFYNTVLIFFIGLTLIIFSGNFETLFLGWEIIGMSSFLLIAFYRDRFLPAKNSLKVFSLYRIADAVLLTALWYAHHLFEKNINFTEFGDIIAHHGNQFTVLGIFFLVVALIKSAQFPFSYWLPRAMEGPTTSSAIFYGALSVHMGLFVLLRTYPLWEGSLGLKIAIVIFGLVTALIATSITRVQSSIKTQIAYASITQIGIMFIEVALGLHWLALFHFVSNALLRTYQLLISPSIVGYLIHDQFFYFVLPPHKVNNSFLGKLRGSLYILGIQEWNMDALTTYYLWRPIKMIGRFLKHMEKTWAYVLSLIIAAVGIYFANTLPVESEILHIISAAAAIIGILYYLRAFEIKSSPTASWNLTLLGHLYSLLFLAITASWNWTYILMYSVGIIVTYIIGYACLHYLKSKNEVVTLHDFQGYMYQYPKVGHIFFLACLGFMAFPITPSFLGQDILLSFIHRGNTFEIVLFGIAYFFSGISIMRLYGKIFFGPNHKVFHEIAYKSS